MKLQEAINAVGPENIQYQRLLDCLKSAKTDRKGITTITFQTKEVATNDLIYNGEHADKVGIILWLPKDKLVAAQDAARAAKSETPV